MEASGTGNMKLALNGAITIGTLDGANIEIREHVGADNMVIFGLTAEEVAEKQQARIARRRLCREFPRLSRVVESLAAGEFSQDDPGRYAPIVQSRCSTTTASWWRPTSMPTGTRSARSMRCGEHASEWWRAAILNTARMGWFSSDRAIREYARDIWHVPVG